MNPDIKDYKSIKRHQIISKEEIQEDDLILCNHCKRTRNNKLYCLGICVADSEY